MSTGCNDTAGVLVLWLHEPLLHRDGQVRCSVRFGLRLTAQSRQAGSGCYEEVVQDDEDVDDCVGA